jgi:hypothetical protein
MGARRASFVRWSSANNPNGCSNFGARYLTIDERAAATKFLNERTAIDGATVTWSDRDWALTENIRLRYVNGRAAEKFSLPNNNEWESVLSLVLDGCGKIIEAMERTDYTAEKLWTWVGSDWDGNGEDPWKGLNAGPNQPGLKKECLAALLLALRDRTGRIEATQRGFDAKAQIWMGDVGDAWCKFIVRLDMQWRAKGLKPTASKSDRQKRSPFVAWVAFLMRTLPEPLWQHMHGVSNGSWGALSKEISRALRNREKVLRLIEGTR